MQVEKQHTESPPMGANAPTTAPDRSRTRQAPRSWLGRLLSHPKALVGFVILLVFGLMAAAAPLIAPGDPSAFVAAPHLPPSREHLFGTTGQGQDVFAQTIWGARLTLLVGLFTGGAVIVIGALIGMTAGYFGGRIDDLLSLLTNVFLIIPGLPLAVVLAAYLPPGPVSITLVLTVTGWAWNARVLRAQTMSLREKDFVAASVVSGEQSAHTIFVEIMPNMTSLAVSAFIGATIYALGASVGLEFLGLGNVSEVTWGTNLYWARNNAALLTGAWWTIVPTGLCVALVGYALSMINYAIDEITNPRLRAEKEQSRDLRKALRAGRATPVVRRSSLR